MKPLRSLAVLAGLFLPLAGAHAHGVCGARLFASTLIIDDPAVADEASFPTYTYTREGKDDGVGPTHDHDFDVEFAKRITENFGLSLGTGFTVADTAHDKTRFGWHNLDLNAKYARCVDEDREFMFAVGVTREFGRTGTTHVGAEAYGSTTPTVYFGKGFTEAPAWWLRPLALTGTFGFTVADKGLKATGADSFNPGAENRWSGGLALQYDIRYLQTGVRDIGLPEWMNRLTPLAELSWSSPATAPSGTGTQYVLAPGLAYRAASYQVTVEALIPLNKASGPNVGAVAQLHLFLDDLLPNTLGKPLLN